MKTKTLTSQLFLPWHHVRCHLQKLVNHLKIKDDSLAETESFIRLIELCQQDADIRGKLIGILSLEPTHRNFMIHSMVEKLILRQAPKDYIRSFQSLLDPEVVTKVLEIIAGQD